MSPPTKKVTWCWKVHLVYGNLASCHAREACCLDTCFSRRGTLPTPHLHSPLALRDKLQHLGFGRITVASPRWAPWIRSGPILWTPSPMNCSVVMTPRQVTLEQSHTHTHIFHMPASSYLDSHPWASQNTALTAKLCKVGFSQSRSNTVALMASKKLRR